MNLNWDIWQWVIPIGTLATLAIFCFIDVVVL